MSYILDALKKSESERGHGAIPGVQTVHSSSINYHQQKKTIWPYFLIAAVLLNIAVIAYFIYTQNNLSQPALAPVAQNNSILANSTETSANTAPTTIAEAPVSITPAKPTPATSVTQLANVTPDIPVKHTKTVAEDKVKVSALARETAANKPSARSPIIKPFVEPTNERSNEPYDQPYDKKIVEQYELPENIQRQLPSLVISAHVFSSNPAQRSVIINNEFFEEKDYILDDVSLYEITGDGVIFSYNGFLFHNRTVSSWQ